MKTRTAENVLDHSLEAFSASNDEDLYRAIENATPPRIETVLEGYRKWAEDSFLSFPALKEGELRPYFVTSSGLASWAQSGLPDLEAFDDQNEIWTAVDSIKHRLLYCHSLALDDPMGSLLYTHSVRNAESSRARLLNFVNFLLHMAPLIRSGIICLKPPDIYLPDEAWGTRWSKVSQRVEEQLKDDPVTKTMDIGELAEAAPEARDELAKLNFPDYENWLLSQLIDIDLPGVGALMPEDLVSIRMSSGVFADWRTTLSDAIRYADNAVPEHVWGRNAAVRKEVNARLQEGRAKLEATMPKSTFLKSGRAGTVTMLGGALGVGVSMLIDPSMTLPAIIAALSTSATAATVQIASDITGTASGAAATAAKAHFIAVLR